MGAAKNAMEIFSVLEKSNCRECGEKTCLAFAGAVYMGRKKIQDCPRLNHEQLGRFSGRPDKKSGNEAEQEEFIRQAIGKVTSLDFAAAAKRIAGRFQERMLTIPILGKNLAIRPDGSFKTDLHIIPWVVGPVLDYVLRCQGVPVTGNWISFREISGGKEKYALFKKRGEDVLQQLADKYTDFFNDIVHMFNGKKVEERFESDVSVVLYPFPLVPIMICYWRPDEGLGSSLNVFFDQSVDANLGIDSAFSLGTGLAQMFEKLAAHHGF